jgi:hypothetical protein
MHILTEQKIIVNLEDKSEIEDLISYNGVSYNELRVLEKSQISGLLATIRGRVSLSIIAVSDKQYGVPNYIMGLSENLKIVTVKKQDTPLAVKNYGIKRDKDEFRANDLYLSYLIIIESPSQSMRTKLDNHRALAPWATADRPYRGK